MHDSIFGPSVDAGISPANAGRVGTVTVEFGVDELTLGIGFFVGVVVGAFVVGIRHRKAVTARTGTFKLSNFFQSDLEYDRWNPFRIRTEPRPNAPMTDDERVIRLLVSNEGRMKQADIVSETQWSEAKVSRLLTRMEQQGDLSRTNVGRTNLVFLGEFRRTD